MAVLSGSFLLEEEDGLPVGQIKPHSRRKLRVISTYFDLFNTVSKDKPWSDRYYIDLQCGSGKNRLGNKIVFGSPLLALTSQHSFTQYRFNELDPIYNNALVQRVSVSPQHNTITIFQEDANKVVRWICEEIAEQDALAKLRRKWSTFNLAFLDPYGLELQWETVEHLAQMNKMDLIINFSTSGLNRYIDQAVNSREATKIDSFFGTDEWRDLYDPSATATVKRRIWIDFYINRLAKYGYVRFLPDLGDSGEVSVKNRRNVQIYSLVFASKHPLGGKLWNVAAKDDQPRLPGF